MFCVGRKHTVNFRFYNNNNFIHVSSDLAPCKDRALTGDTAIFELIFWKSSTWTDTLSLQIQLLNNSTALDKLNESE